MIKVGGYIGARTRHTPPRKHTKEKKIVWVRGVACCGTQTNALLTVAV